MAGDADTYARVLAKANVEASLKHPHDPRKARKLIRERTGILSRADMDDLASDAAKAIVSMKNRHRRIFQGNVLTKSFWKVWYTIF